MARSDVTLLPLLLLGVALLPACQAGFYSFTPYGESQAAILLQADFTIRIKAYEAGEHVATFTQDSRTGGDVKLYGVHGDRSFLQIHFHDKVDWALVFNKISPEQVTLNREVQFVPSSLFPGLTPSSDLIVFGEHGKTDLRSAAKSFQCDHETTTAYVTYETIPGSVSFTVSVTVSNFRVQAYNVLNGVFSPATHCKLDSEPDTTTPRAVTGGTGRNTTRTTKPTTTTTSGPPVVEPGHPMNTFTVNHTVGNTTTWCISLEGRISFRIKYRFSLNRYATELKTKTLGVPATATAGGQCMVGPGRQKLSLHFYNEWKLDFNFQLNKELSRLEEEGDSQSKLDYEMESIDLKYTLNPYIFPDVYVEKNYTVNLSLNQSDSLPRKKATTGFFLCHHEKHYAMSKDVTLITSDLKFKAFIENQDVQFYGKPDKCEKDTEHVTHPLYAVVGCLVVTFFILVILSIGAAVMIKCGKMIRRRKRMRNKYGSI